jgi:hypothetical protein
VPGDAVVVLIELVGVVVIVVVVGGGGGGDGVAVAGVVSGTAVSDVVVAGAAKCVSGIVAARGICRDSTVARAMTRLMPTPLKRGRDAGVLSVIGFGHRGSGHADDDILACIRDMQAPFSRRNPLPVGSVLAP